MSGLSDSVIKDDALGLEVTTLEEIVKAVEVKDSAKEANRTLGKHNDKINEVTKVGLAMHVKARIMATGHTKEDRLQRCLYRDKPCPKYKLMGHFPVSYMCRKRLPQAGKVKEVKQELPPLGATLGSSRTGGRILTYSKSLPAARRI